MRRELGHKYERGTNTVVVYIFNQEIEQMFSQQSSSEAVEGKGRTVGEREHEQILSALRAELASLQLTAQIPVILTSPEVCAALPEAIAPEFLRMFVISYEELPPDINVQPVARIGLAAASLL
jgi:type III secretion protein V